MRPRVIRDITPVVMEKLDFGSPEREGSNTDTVVSDVVPLSTLRGSMIGYISERRGRKMKKMMKDQRRIEMIKKKIGSKEFLRKNEEERRRKIAADRQKILTVDEKAMRESTLRTQSDVRGSNPVDCEDEEVIVDRVFDDDYMYDYDFYDYYDTDYLYYPY